jgi:hypothetical protein
MKDLEVKDNNRDFIIVSFYTKEYKDVVKYLITSLEWLKLPYYIREVEKKENWQETTWYKPSFIKEMIIANPNKKIFWVDADAAFLRYPTEIEQCQKGFNICYHSRLTTPHPKIPPGVTKDKRLYHSGCVVATSESLPLLEAWINSKNRYDVPDQYLINFAVEAHPEVPISPLSLDYLNTLHDNQRRCGSLVVTRNPAVMHFIYSNATEDGKPCSDLLSLYSTNGKKNAERLLLYRKELIKRGAKTI